MSRARQQQKIEELCAATLRAISGDGRLHYRGHLLHCGDHPMRTYAPHLRVAPDQSDLAVQRAVADGMALRLVHSDAALHRGLCPPDPVERLMFELFEQLRVETLAPEVMPGMKANLLRRFADWSHQFHLSGATESSLGILFHAVVQMCWSRLNAVPVIEETADLIEIVRAGIAAAVGPPIAGMRKWRHDQERFAAYALELARLVGAMVRAENEEQDAESKISREENQRGLALLPDFDQEESTAFPMAATGTSKARGETGDAYKVFTTQYDVEVSAAALVRKQLLREFRERLDLLTLQQGANIPRLARLFEAILADPHQDGWLFGEEDGRIDGRRLAQLVISPAERRLFKRERTRPLADAAVGLLIDCSGSMKGLNETVAVLVDILVRALDMAGVETEVLGFTTGAWNGGRPYQDWLRRGRPAYPGRVNEVCHMVFKECGRNWRRSRNDIAALLKNDLFREGIDGEAVEWASNRLLACSCKRRILCVISDGCPMDSATELANDSFYLDNHLKAVIRRLERESRVEIIGVGVGLDLSPFYRRTASADFSQGLDNRLFFEIAELMRKPHRFS